MAADQPITPKSPSARATRVLNQSDVRHLLDMDACIAATEEAFRLLASGGAPAPAVASTHVAGGAFHVKAAALTLERPYYAAKTNANFPANPETRGLPTIQGTLVLCDGEDGRPLAVMDSMALTALRTAAATAVAAKHLAPPDAMVAAIIGCGVQAADQVRALARVRPIERLLCIDSAAGRADRLARAMTAEFGLAAEPLAPAALADATRRSRIVITCTTAKSAFLGPGHVEPGTFVAAVGADNPEKNEITPALMAESVVVTDMTAQCAAIGDLKHAVAAGAMAARDVAAELGEVVSGTKPGRTGPDEVVIFDSTGVAVQDVAAASVVYRLAEADGAGLAVDFAA